jgi:hypothetical protein
VIVVTHSDLAAFLRCRRSWALGYLYDYNLPEVGWGALSLGSRVHAALEVTYKTGKDPVLVHQALAELAVAQAEEDGAPPWGMDQLYQDVTVGRACLEGWKIWQEESGADHGLDVVSVEQKLEAPILDGKVLLRGKVDLLRRRVSDGALIIDDWKTTGQWHAGLREKLERSYQHYVYLVLVSMLNPEMPIQESWYTVIKKSQRNMGFAAVERFRVPGTTRAAGHKLRQIEMIAQDMIDEVERIKVDPERMYPSPDESCRWCDYRKPCETWDDMGQPVAFEMLESSMYVKGRRHARYEEGDTHV